MLHTLGKMFVVLSLVSFLAVCIACGGSGAANHSSSSVLADKDNPANHDPGWSSADIEGRVMAQDFVRDNLRFPDDASFPWATTNIEFGDPERKDVWANGKVKAKNAFGAELTYRFEIRMARNVKTWHPYYLVIDGERMIDRREDPEILTILGIEPVTVEESKAKMTVAPPEPTNTDISEMPAFDKRQPAPVPLIGVIEFEAETERIWQSQDGNFSTMATLIKFDRDKAEVQLRKSDGTMISVPITTLAIEDRNYIRGQAREAE